MKRQITGFIFAFGFLVFAICLKILSSFVLALSILLSVCQALFLVVQDRTRRQEWKRQHKTRQGTRQYCIKLRKTMEDDKTAQDKTILLDFAFVFAFVILC